MKKDPKKYEAPKVIYEGKITTRAGTPSSAPANPAEEIFGNSQ